MLKPELLGLVLAGGQSQRMGQDKSEMIYPALSPLPQYLRLLQDLEACGLSSYISCRSDQNKKKVLSQQIIPDQKDLVGGPGVGILSAHLQFPKAAWLVIACDFPWLGKMQIEELISARCPNGLSLATENKDQILEPLFAIWEPETLKLFLEEFSKGNKSPQKVLQLSNCEILKIKDLKALTNINTVAEVEAHEQLRTSNHKKT